MNADANQFIGTGHVMRCLAIAEELISRNFTVIFIGKIENLPWLESKVKSKKFLEIYSIESEFSFDKNNTVLIFDTYIKSKDDNFINPKNWKKTVLIADEFTPSYTANIIFHLSLTRSKNLSFEKPPNKLLQGLEFFPVRKSIKSVVDLGDTRKLSIAVVGGGIDVTNFVPEMSNSLTKIPGEFEVNLFTNRPRLVSYDKRFKVFPISDMLDEIGNTCQLAFSTASTSGLEFMARGSAVGLACSTRNQWSYYLRFSELCSAIKIGEFTGNNWNLYDHQIKKLVQSEELRKKLIVNSRNFFDLDGAQRIVDEILINY